MPNPYVVAGAASAAGSLADKILGGGDRDRLERFIAFLRKRLDQGSGAQGAMSGLYADVQRSQMPEVQRYGEIVNKRLGLDSGVAQGDLMHRLVSTNAGIRANLGMQGIQLDQDFRNRILGYLTSAEQQRASM